MPADHVGHIIIHFPEITNFWINGTDYTDYCTNYEFIEQENDVGSFVADLVSIGDTEKLDIAEGHIIKFMLTNNLLFKGIIGKVEYKSYEFCTIQGMGAVETYMKNSMVSAIPGRNGAVESGAADNRPSYVGTTSGVASFDIVSGQMIEVSNVSIGTNQYLGHIVARSDCDSVLSFLDGVAENLSGVWWGSYGSYPYDSNYFNVASQRSDGTVKAAFNVSGDNQNADETGRQIDEDSLWNSVKILGYGDGVNQISSKAYHATDNFTRLAVSCTSSATTLTVEDGSVLPSSGSLWVGMELVTLSSKSGNNLTVVRAAADGTVSNQKYLKAYAHSRKVAVFDSAYTEISTDGNSRIDSDGLKQKTIIDKAILDQDALDQAACNLLVEHWDARESVTLAPSDFTACLVSGIGVSDIVSVTDADSGVSGNYRIVKRRIKYNEGLEEIEYELSNSRSTLTSSMSETAEEIKIGSQYMQGSTSIFNVQSYENCDVGNPLYIRFYLPSDLIKVNKANLDLKVKDYRAYVSTSLTDPGHTHNISIDSSSVGPHTHTITGATSASGYGSIGSASAADHISITGSGYTTITMTSPNIADVPAFTEFIIVLFDASTASPNYDVRIKNNTTTTTYLDINNIDVQTKGGLSYNAVTTEDCRNDVIEFRIDNDATCLYDAYVFCHQYGKHTHSVTGQSAESAYAPHGHTASAGATSSTTSITQSYGISTAAGGSDAVIDVDIATNTAESTWGRIATDLTGSAVLSGAVTTQDITSWVTSGITLSSGNWRVLKLTPNKACRVEANIFAKVFIQAK
jgi:hypothetical protein